MSRKSNKNQSGKKTEVDIEKLDRYVSDRPERELHKFQIAKSALVLASVVMLLIAMFLPSNTDWHDTHKSLVAFFSTLNIIGLIYAMFMLFQDNRNQQIRKTVLKTKAPHFGYDKKLTYVTCEVYVLVMLFFVAEQSVILYFARDGYAIAGLCLMTVGFACSLASRMVLYKANAGHMIFINVENPESGQSGEKQTDMEQAEMPETQPQDDFYAPIDNTDDNK